MAGAGISGSDVRDMILAAVERSCGADHAPHRAEHLSDDASRYAAGETRDFATVLGLVPCLTPVRSPERRGARMSESFVKTLGRDCVRLTPLPDAATGLGLVARWITDHSAVHPHSALRMRSPAEFRDALQPQPDRPVKRGALQAVVAPE